MYKLFLMLHYLKSRVIAYFAVVCVALCVAMLLIAVSVMNGFLRKIEAAAKGLFGDIVVESAGRRGIANYDEFVALTAGGPFPLQGPLEQVQPAGTDTGILFRGTPADAELWALRYRSPAAGPVSFPGFATLYQSQKELGRVSGRFELLDSNQIVFTPGPEAPLKEFEAAAGLTLKDCRVRFPRGIEEVEAASVIVLGHAFLLVPEWPDYFQDVQVIGIRLPERAAVTDFEEGLFVQAGVADPNFTPSMARILKRLADDAVRIRVIHDRERARAEAERKKKNAEGFPPETEDLLWRIQKALELNATTAGRLRRARQTQEDLESLLSLRSKLEEEGDDDRIRNLDDEILRVRMLTYEPPDNRIILGLGIPGFSFRTDRGEVIRLMPPGRKVVLEVVPLGRKASRADLELSRGRFSVCDDCRTGVASIDSAVVYVPFRKMQLMNKMYEPDRCSQIHIKVTNALAKEQELRKIAAKVERTWIEFDRHFPAAAMTGMSVLTWRQRQGHVVAPIESQRTLVIIMFGIMSLVSVVLIFVIFYMIVHQKTREIGVLKAVGASSSGVAAIFLVYGAVVGLIGSALGTVIGHLFVRNINPIHDWVGRTFGLVVWDRKVFMFDLIPNEVQWSEAARIILWAVVSGVVGALIPAIRAARMQPVEALRYE
ncbi:MAG TPA: FtsX-like permease family protein [Phycisphaerae bacterium]|nr:FtsX-like permease family protein [Phycisphaerae bacterium]